MKKRILALILILCMCLTILPTAAVADDSVTTNALELEPTATTLNISYPKDDTFYSWDDSPTYIEWNSVTGAAGYYVRVLNTGTKVALVDTVWTTDTKLYVDFPSENVLYKIWVGAVTSSAEKPVESFASGIIWITISHEPEVTLDGCDNITADGATLKMTLSANYGAPMVDSGFYIGTSSTKSKMTKYSFDDYGSYSATEKGTKSMTVTGLKSGTKYYYRAYAEKLVGEEYTSAKNFTTKSSSSGGDLSVSKSSVSFSWSSTSSSSVTVTCGGTYSVSEPDYDVPSSVLNSDFNYEWLDVSKSGSTLKFTPNRPNYSASARTATVTVSYGGKSKDITVTQKACGESAPKLTLKRAGTTVSSGDYIGNFALPQSAISVDIASITNVRKLTAFLREKAGGYAKDTDEDALNDGLIVLNLSGLPAGEYKIEVYASNSPTKNDYYRQSPFSEDPFVLYFTLSGGDLSVSNSSVSFSWSSTSSSSVTVTCGGTYSVSEPDYDVPSSVLNSDFNYEWLDVSKSGSTLKFTPNRPNYSASARTATVTVSYGGKSKDITVTQKACGESAPKLTLKRAGTTVSSGDYIGNFALPQSAISVDIASITNVRKLTAFLREKAGGYAKDTDEDALNDGLIVLDLSSLSAGEYKIEVYASNSPTKNDYYRQSPFSEDPFVLYFTLSGGGGPGGGGVETYNASAAVAYAYKYNGKHPGTSYNSEYNVQSSDCTNFVSQCVKEGGIETDSTWKPYTNAWVGTGPFIRYFANTKLYPTYVRECVDNVNELKVSSPAGRTISASDIAPGDIIFTFGSEPNKSAYEYGHAMIATRVVGSTVYFCGHTNDRCGCEQCKNSIALSSINVLVKMTSKSGDNSACTISYNANGGSGSMSSDTVNYGSNYRIKTNTFTRTGYTFQGWALSSGGSIAYYDGDTIPNIAGSITLYALWKANTVTVSYNANGGSGSMSSDTVNYGSSYKIKTNTFTRTGYTFQGWATSSGGSVVYSAGATISSVTSNITLYAVWKANTVTVSYNANGGSGSMSSDTVNYGSSYKIKTNSYTRTGYTFQGWATSSGGSVVYSAGATISSVTSNITLYAVWNANTVTVSYNANGGSGSMSSDTVNYGSSYKIKTNTFTRTGYTFQGWATSSDGNVKYSDGATISNITGNIPLYAVWSLNHTHSYIYSVSKEPTTTSTGTITGTCSCGDSATVTLPKLSTTDYTYKVTKEAGCTEDGSATYTWKTTTYGSFAFNVTLSKLGHDYHDGKCSHCGADDPNVSTTTKLIISNETARKGETVVVKLSVKEAPPLKSMAITGLTYDKNVLELVKGEWKLENSVIASWDSKNETGVIAFSENVDVNKTILELSFKVKDSAADGDYDISCLLTASTKLQSGAETAVAVGTEKGKITVVSVIRGDVNGDNLVTSDDAIYLLYHTLMPSLYPINQNADFNGDGMVTSDDAIHLLYHTLMPSLYPLH